MKSDGIWHENTLAVENFKERDGTGSTLAVHSHRITDHI